MAERAQTPASVKHCVAALAKKYGTSKAFAICIAQMQKAGMLKPGTIKSTSKGKKADKRHSGEKDAGKKMKSYERFLKAARKVESEEEENPALDTILQYAGLTPSHPGWEVPEFAREPTQVMTDQQRRVAGTLDKIHTPWVLDESVDFSDPERFLLAATIFWGMNNGVPKSGETTTPTLRKGVRHVARKQGVDAADLNKAERSLIKRKMLVRSGEGAATLALTAIGYKAAKRLAPDTPIPPWKHKHYK